MRLKCMPKNVGFIGPSDKQGIASEKINTSLSKCVIYMQSTFSDAIGVQERP